MALCASAVFQKGRQYADEEPVLADQGFNILEAAFEYQPHRPEESVLYRVVAENIESFLARQQERGRVVPRFVERELRAFLDCGVLARGFVRVHCDICRMDRVVPYSCKHRGFCPSCGGRRMADTAAHLVDHVFPEVAGAAMGAVCSVRASLSSCLRFFSGQRCAADLRAHRLCLD